MCACARVCAHTFYILFLQFTGYGVGMENRIPVDDAGNAILDTQTQHIDTWKAMEQVRHSPVCRPCLPCAAAVVDVEIRWDDRASAIQRVQLTLRITTLGGASEKCSFSRSVLIPEVSLYYVYS